MLRNPIYFTSSPPKYTSGIFFPLHRHMAFVCSTARLYAEVCGVGYREEDLSPETVTAITASTTVLEFRPSSKVLGLWGYIYIGTVGREMFVRF